MTELFTPRLADYLANRLRVADYLRQHPNLVDAPVDVGVVVMGMPRTGTTIISYLLDCDPRWRSLLNWEATNSVPPPTTETLRTDPRCVEAKKFQEQIFPQLGGNVPHWEWADGPTECIFVQSQDRKSLALDAANRNRRRPLDGLPVPVCVPVVAAVSPRRRSSLTRQDEVNE